MLRLNTTVGEFFVIVDGKDNFIDVLCNIYYNLEETVQTIKKMTIDYAKGTVFVCQKVENTTTDNSLTINLTIYFNVILIFCFELRMHFIIFIDVVRKLGHYYTF